MSGLYSEKTGKGNAVESKILVSAKPNLPNTQPRNLVQDYGVFPFDRNMYFSAFLTKELQQMA